MSKEDVKIAPSELGTKDFWDKRYEMELENYKTHGDEGEVWFGVSAENRIVKYLVDSKTDKNAKILDLGCGNGSVLRRLRSKGYRHLKGVDYCRKAVELSEEASREEQDDDDVEIRFEQLDITSPRAEFFCDSFDVILDKGTWDAMSLSEDRTARLASYLDLLQKSLASGGRFVIFSCNFTIEELREQFSSSHLEFVCEVAAAHSFSFGGKQGVTSTGAVFRKTP